MNAESLAELSVCDAADGVQQQVVGAVVRRGGRVLLLRRPSDEFRGGTWELPSGKVEPGEDLLSALRREVHEETGLTVTGCPAYLAAFDYVSGSGRRTRQHTFAVATDPADVVLTEHDAHHWAATPDERAVSSEVRRVLLTQVAEPQNE